jgi:hypothetical protein
MNPIAMSECRASTRLSILFDIGVVITMHGKFSNTNTLLKVVFDELVEQISVALLSRIDSKLNAARGHDELVDEPAMAEIAKVSAETIQRCRKRNEIPFVKCGTRILYRPADVIAALTVDKSGGAA